MTDSTADGSVSAYTESMAGDVKITDCIRNVSVTKITIPFMKRLFIPYSFHVAATLSSSHASYFSLIKY